MPDQLTKLRDRFGCTRIVLVGDRGMLTDTEIDNIRKYPGLGWISALRSAAIRRLLNAGHLQRSLFDTVNLAEISSPDFPGERLMACYNPLLADERHRKRLALLGQTDADLTRLAAEVTRRTEKPLTQTEIALKAGRILQRSKVAKHYRLEIADGVFHWERRQNAIAREEELDGLYVIRTSEPAERLSAADSVRSYKRLASVEKAFRALKGLDLLVRPIRHRVEPRVRAHLFLCAWRTTWNGSCGGRGRRCCLRRRSWRRHAEPVTRSSLLSRRKR